MASILYSGNADKPNTFSAADMEHVATTYNSVLDAIDYILRYIGVKNNDLINRALGYYDMESLSPVTGSPHNKLVSTVGMAADFHKRMALRTRDSFSQISTERILNAVSDYENRYAKYCYDIMMLTWAFQTFMLQAFDKLHYEICEFRKKYKNVPQFHNAMSEVDKLLRSTMDTIGTPENQWLNGAASLTQIFKIRDKLSANNTPIQPLHLYHDIMRFQDVKESVLATKREHSRKKHYNQMSRELNTMDTQNFELAQSNHELAKRIAILERENAQLRAANANLVSENTKLDTQNVEFCRQIDSLKRGIIGKMLVNRAQKRK
jgi:hypothetical protein